MTIFALATAPGRAGVAIMRVSGPDTSSLVTALTQKALPSPRVATLRILVHDQKPIDRALVLFFAGPASYTGEDMAEFHIHGGRAVAASLSRALVALGARPAAPGAFTRRAFENGKLDLTQAEAIADLAAAETEVQAAQALDQANGALLVLYEDWRERLVAALALTEASLDFPDEDLPHDLLAPVAVTAAHLALELRHHIADARRGARLRDGITVAVLGAPNAGKSSLVNALSARAAAIVSPIAGTTRDAIEVPLDLGGYPVIIIDTAGLCDSTDPIEQEGIVRAKARAGTADVKLLIFDASRPRDAQTLALIDDAALVVLNKSDLPPFDRPQEGDISLSTLTGQGMAELLFALTEKLGTLAGEVTRPAPTRERHRIHLAEAEAALRAYPSAPTPDLAAEELRRAATALGRLTGRVDSEELLERIFRDFCIGK